MVEKENATPDIARAGELSNVDPSELREAQLEAAKGGFCGFKIPVSSQTRSMPSTSEFVITKNSDA